VNAAIVMWSPIRLEVESGPRGVPTYLGGAALARNLRRLAERTQSYGTLLDCNSGLFL